MRKWRKTKKLKDKFGKQVYEGTCKHTGRMIHSSESYETPLGCDHPECHYSPGDKVVWDD